MQRDHREQLLQSWQAKAAAWLASIQERSIESRNLVTDTAILQAILALEPKRVLDLGCGEGWLCRGLIKHGIESVGVDASVPMVEAARAASNGGGQYRACGYAELSQQADVLGKFDLLVCNFTQLEPLETILRDLHLLLAPGGRLLIQTLHPWRASHDQLYQDGWRLETFKGFGDGITAPAPWFFRTLSSWLSLLSDTGWRLEWLQEPLHPESVQPVSLLMLLEPVARA